MKNEMKGKIRKIIWEKKTKKSAVICIQKKESEVIRR